MSVALIFPDVEDVLTTVLPSLLAGHGMAYPVATRIPNPRPASFWRVIATGGNRANLVQQNPTVTIESWSTSETHASAMARTMLAVVESLAGQHVDGVTISRARDFGAPVNLPDPDSGQYRYTSTGSILLRGTAFT